MKDLKNVASKDNKTYNKVYKARKKKTEIYEDQLKAELERERSLGNCLRKIVGLANERKTIDKDGNEVENKMSLFQVAKVIHKHNALDILIEHMTKSVRAKWDKKEIKRVKFTLNGTYLSMLKNPTDKEIAQKKVELANKQKDIIIQKSKSAGLNIDKSQVSAEKIRSNIEANSKVRKLDRKFTPLEVMTILREIDARFYALRKNNAKATLVNIKNACGMPLNDRDVKQHKQAVNS